MTYKYNELKTEAARDRAVTAFRGCWELHHGETLCANDEFVRAQLRADEGPYAPWEFNEDGSLAD